MRQIRIVRQDNNYTAYYQTDDVNWVVIGSHIIDRQPVSIGLLAAQTLAMMGDFVSRIKVMNQ